MEDIKVIKVLLVEDDLVDQMAFKRAVDQQGLPYQYTIAASIYQAREVLNNEKFDMVVCDLSLQDGTLFDILDKVVNKDIPIIITTGNGDEETAVKAMKSGADDYIIKDIEFNYLKVMAATIKKVLENKKDLLQRQQAEAALRLSEERFSKAFNGSPTAMAINTLGDGKIIDVNDVFCRMAGSRRNEILGHTSLELGLWLNQNDYQLVREMIIKKRSVHDMEFSFRNKFEEQRVGLYSAEVLDINGKTCILNIINDITERKKAEEEIRYLSFNDKLTGLYNRAFFEEELKRIDTKRQLPICVIMGDLNGLKLINDSMGHQEGDKLLIKVAEILEQSCRREDIVARWGGDEFIVLLPRCDYEAGLKVMKRIEKDCKYNDNLPIQISISLGLASKKYISQDIQEVIKEAEDKMYRNKLLDSRSIRSSFIRSLEKTLWTRSHETEEHCKRIQVIALEIGKAINLSDSELDNLKLLAYLHDIGKIAIPNSILNNSGKLSADEWESIKKHPEIGYRIALNSPELASIADAILYHHERWDGTGYPIGIAGKRIPIMARIIAIVDAYDIMTNGRLYQKPVSQEEAWIEIVRCAGKQFDPELVKIALELNKRPAAG